MAARFRLNKPGVARLLVSPDLLAALVQVGEDIKTAGEAIAPVGAPPDPHPGEYKRSFVVTSQVRYSGRRHMSRRHVVTVRNVALHAAAVEYGNTDGRGGAHHVLLRAALTAGGGP